MHTHAHTLMPEQLAHDGAIGDVPDDDTPGHVAADETVVVVVEECDAFHSRLVPGIH